MEKINGMIKEFNEMYPDYHMELSPEVRSDDSYVLVYVTEPVCGLTSRYYFNNADELSEWIHGVVLD